MNVGREPIWRQIMATPTCWQHDGQRYHESLLRAHRILGEVQAMLERGDSHATITTFIDLCLGAPSEQAFEYGRYGREARP